MHVYDKGTKNRAIPKFATLHVCNKFIKEHSQAKNEQQGNLKKNILKLTTDKQQSKYVYDQQIFQHEANRTHNYVPNPHYFEISFTDI